MLGPPASCRDDQCLAAHLLFSSNGTIGIDLSEHIFASGALPVDAADKQIPSVDWPLHGLQHCGQERCKVARQLGWERAPAVSSLHPNLPTSAAHQGALVRPAEYARRCRLSSTAPMVIHFNGPSKAHVQRDVTLSEWLVDSAMALSMPARRTMGHTRQEK